MSPHHQHVFHGKHRCRYDEWKRMKALKVDSRAVRLTFNGHRSAFKCQDNSLHGTWHAIYEYFFSYGVWWLAHQRHENHPRDVAKWIPEIELSNLIWLHIGREIFARIYSALHAVAAHTKCSHEFISCAPRTNMPNEVTNEYIRKYMVAWKNELMMQEKWKYIGKHRDNPRSKIIY